MWEQNETERYKLRQWLAQPWCPPHVHFKRQANRWFSRAVDSNNVNCIPNDTQTNVSPNLFNKFYNPCLAVKQDFMPRTWPVRGRWWGDHVSKPFAECHRNLPQYCWDECPAAKAVGVKTLSKYRSLVVNKYLRKAQLRHVRRRETFWHRLEISLLYWYNQWDKAVST